MVVLTCTVLLSIYMGVLEHPLWLGSDVAEQATVFVLPSLNK